MTAPARHRPAKLHGGAARIGQAPRPGQPAIRRRLAVHDQPRPFDTGARHRALPLAMNPPVLGPTAVTLYLRGEEGA